jgi:hypothetical protein
LFVEEIGERAQADEPRPNSPGQSIATYAMRPQRRYRGLNACHSPTATDASTPFLPIQAAEMKTNRMDRFTALLIWRGWIFRPSSLPMHMNIGRVMLPDADT